jgi:hypothetical protein
VQQLAYQWAHSPSTTIARGHHHGCARTSSWSKLSKPLLQVPPSLEHRQTRTQQEARSKKPERRVRRQHSHNTHTMHSGPL